jgi:hypothetical protein
VYDNPEYVTEEGIINKPDGLIYPFHVELEVPLGPTHSTVVGDFIL